MIDTQTPESPGWWLARLLKDLEGRQDRYDDLDAYYRGEQLLPMHAGKAVREAYRRLMEMARTNYAELIVEAVRERVMPVGFRTGAAGDENGDSEAWRIWQANSLDADSALVHRSCLALSDAYVIVGGVDDEIGAPLITPEDPRQVIVEHDPRRRRKALAAVKVFRDDVAGVDRAYLYLPGLVYYAAREAVEDVWTFEAAPWDWYQGPQPLPAPVVPVVAFKNRADTFGRSQGEFEPHISLLDRINYTILSRLEIATLQAFRQRGIKGVPTHDADGNEVDYSDIFAADPGAMWQLPDTAEVWESGQVDLGPLRQAIRDDVQDLAAVSRTPLFYLTPEAAQGSAEGASLAREGLVFKTQDRLLQLGESWEQVMSLAFLFAGDTERAARGSMEVMWADPQRYSLSERYDAASKAVSAQVPWRTVMSDVLQFTPQQVDEMEANRATDLLLGAVAQPVEPVQ